MDNKYRLGIYEKALPNTLSFKEKLRIASDCGFDQLEISIDETDEKIARLYNGCDLEIREAIKSESLDIRTMCLSAHRKYPLGSHDPTIRQKSKEIFVKALEFSDRIGVRLIQLAGYDVYYEASDNTSLAFFAEGLEDIVKKAAQYGIILGFETMETEFMDTVQKGMRYVNLISSPYLGMYPDIGNLENAAIKYGHNIVEDIKLGQGHIWAAHLKETKPGHYRNMDFGTGHTPYQICLEELLQQGVRIFTAEFWYLGEEDYKDKVKKANVFLRKEIEKAFLTI